MKGKDVYPYGMYACERSAMPEPKEEKDNFY